MNQPNYEDADPFFFAETDAQAQSGSDSKLDGLLPSAHSVSLPVSPEDVDAFGLDAAFDESPEVYGEALAAKIEYAREQDYRTSDLTAADRLDRSVLAFQVGDRQLGIDVLEIAEVFHAEGLMAVPSAPPEILGLANQRGSVLCVVDLVAAATLEGASRSRRLEAMHTLLVLRDPKLRVSFPIDGVRGIYPLRSGVLHESSDRSGLLGTLELQLDDGQVLVDLIDPVRLSRHLRAIEFGVCASSCPTN